LQGLHPSSALNFEFNLWYEDKPMTNLLEVRGLTVELPTAAGWVWPVNDVSLHIAAGESLGLLGE
jgi:ABC-type polysaccharide/polyol phosphate transport system ATPase subunit